MPLERKYFRSPVEGMTTVPLDVSNWEGEHGAGIRIRDLRRSLSLPFDRAAKALKLTASQLVELEHGQRAFAHPEGEAVASERLRDATKTPGKKKR